MHHYKTSNHVVIDEAEKAALKSCTVICIYLLALNMTEIPSSALSDAAQSSARDSMSQEVFYDVMSMTMLVFVKPSVQDS